MREEEIDERSCVVYTLLVYYEVTVHAVLYSTVMCAGKEEDVQYSRRMGAQLVSGRSVGRPRSSGRSQSRVACAID